MPRRIAIAALQMDASPAPKHERLAIADRLVNQAHERGAQLVVPPEVFNTGYGYTDANYERTETLGGASAADRVVCPCWHPTSSDAMPRTKRAVRILASESRTATLTDL